MDPTLALSSHVPFDLLRLKLRCKVLTVLSAWGKGCTRSAHRSGSLRGKLSMPVAQRHIQIAAR
jgi:hypothetical protein